MQNINPNQKVDVVDLTKNFATDSKLTKKDLSKYIQTLIGTNPLNTKDKKALASFVKTSKRIGKKNVYIPDHIANSSKVEANNIDERKTAVNNITDLIQNAILIEISPNTNKKGKPNVDNYLRFYVPVKINNDIFTIRIVAENNSSKNLFNVLNADIYDLIIDKKMPTSVYIPANTQSNIVKSTSNNIVANNSQNINPAQITIKDMLSNVEDADGNIYFQSAVTAGAETSAEISDAQKEWQEKGTDSKYFKKWFGDSKVVDENGQPLVAYHGTESNEAFSVFETNSPDGTPAIYFSSNKKVANSYSGNLPIYEVYLKMENPLEVDAQGKEYNDFAAEMRSNIDYANRNGYDGVIVKNIRDDWSQEKSGKVATTYVVFSPEQIKSVDNQGTFDEGNPNIYYQPAYHGSPAKFDKFDHDYIGSGEGAQVHGYGTYVAESKHIADERYRKRLTNDDFNNEKYYYDNQLIDDRNKKAILATIVENGKDKVISVREKSLEKYKYSDEEYQQKKEELAWVKTLDENKIEKKTDRGQLYEVEIPEDEEMLDEDLPFSEQPQKVQEAIKQICEDYVDNNKLVDLNVIAYTNNTLEKYKNNLAYKEGRNIYGIISEAFGGDKQASLLLNKYGIKGIKYNGQTDGQCYVIFNPENIDITRTFYQEGISPKTSQKAKEVVNALKKIADGSEEETVKDLRNDLEQYGGTNDVTFVFGNDKKGIKHIAQKHGAKTLLKVFDTVVDGKVLRYVPNKKTVVLSKSDYEAVLSLDENGNKKTWLLSGWKTKEKSSGVSREVGTQSTSTQIKPTFSRQDLGAELNNSITNSDGDFNPKQSQKRTGYVFQEPAQPNLFVENAAQNHNKGFVGIDLKGNRGLTDINRNLILIGTTGDITTVLHESAHYFLNMLEELERVPDHSPKVDDVLFAIRKTLKNDGTPFTRSQHEKFAKGFEHYIYTGNARNNLFQEIYEDIKNLLKNIYEFVQKGQYFTTGEGALTEEEMKNFNNVFDEIFKLENKTVKERVFAKVLALDEKEEYGLFEELTLFISLFLQYRHLCTNF